MADTQDEIEEREKLIEVMLEQIRTGEKGIDAQIKLYLETTKTGKGFVMANKAVHEFTGGIKDSIKAVGTSSGNFNDLSGAVTGSVHAVTGLLTAIPIFGDALKELGDAAAETATYAFGQVQDNFASFQELSKAGLIGAEGITGMAEDMMQARIPLQTYSKLLSENSENLAFFSSSAVDGGKQFSKIMHNMAGETGMPLRRLGFSIEEIGETVIDFQVMNQRMGLRQTLTQDQLQKKSMAYAQELDLVAKLTGQSRKELQKAREDQAGDARFRTKLNQLYAEGKDTEANALNDYVTTLKLRSPELARAAMDLATGFTNTDAAIKATTSGMANTMKTQMQDIEFGNKTAVDALNATATTAKKMAEVGGFQFAAAQVFQSGMAPFINYAELSDLAGVGMKNVAEASERQVTVMTAQGTQTDRLATSMRELQESTAKINNFFIATPAATKAIEGFAAIINESVDAIATAFGVDYETGEESVKSTKSLEQSIGEKAGLAILSWLAPGNAIEQITRIKPQATRNLVEEANNDAQAVTGPSNIKPIPILPRPKAVQPTPNLAAEKRRPVSTGDLRKDIDFSAEIEKTKANIVEQEAAFANFKKDAMADGTMSTAERREAREMKTLLNSIRLQLVSLNGMASKQVQSTDNVGKAIKNNG